MHKSYAWYYMQIEKFLLVWNFVFWNSLTFFLLKFGVLQTLPPYKRSLPEIEKKVRY